MSGTKSNRIVILFIAEFLLILILLPGCFKQEELIFTLYGEECETLFTQTENHGEVYSDRIVLTPGVYQMKIRTNLTDQQSIYVEMQCEESHFKALRCNGITIFSGNDYLEAEVYALDRVSEAYVYCAFYNTAPHALLEVDVYRTCMGNRMFLFILLIFFAVLDAMILFRRRILEGRVTKKQQIVFWTLAAGVLLAYFPYLTDYFSIGADSLYHWGRIANLKNALLQGSTFPVRMQGTWLCDHGYATSFFYGDLFLYLPALLQLLGFSIMTVYKMFVFVILTATAVIAYASFQRCVRDEYAALAGSMIYLLNPYHIYNIYCRGALGECLAMIFLPLVCCGICLLYTEDVTGRKYRRYKWYVIWGVSGVLQSHLITTEMTVIFMFFFCVMFWKKTFRRQTLVQLLEAALIALLINAWFWLPMLYMMGNDVYYLEKLKQAEMQSRGLQLAGYFQWLPNKGNAQTGMYYCEPVQVGAGAMILLLVYAIWKLRSGKKDRICSMLALFSILSLIMCSEYLPWNAMMKLPGIGYVVASLQFPSRWMVLATVFTSMFSAFFCSRVREEKGTLIRMAAWITVFITAVSAVYHVNSIAFEMGPVWLYNAENMGSVSVGNGEYLLLETELSELSYHKPVAEDGLHWSQYEQEGTNVWIALDNTTDEVRYIEIPLFGYKGYGITKMTGDTDEVFITEERGAHGDLRLAVPAGYLGKIQIAYVGSVLFHLAEAVSFVSLAVILLQYFYQKRKRVRDEADNG